VDTPDIMKSTTTNDFCDDVFQEDRVLKQCPFCGEYALYAEDMRFVGSKPENPRMFPKWYVVCTGCGVHTPVADIPTVTKIWNSRYKGEYDK